MAKKSGAKDSVLGIEVLSAIGFSFLFAWFLIAGFWVPSVPVDANVANPASAVHGFVIVGLPVAYAIQHFLGKRESYSPLNKGVMAVVLLASLVSCSLFFAVQMGCNVPPFFLAVACFLSGVATAFGLISWLHVSSYLPISHYTFYVGAALAVGCVTFAFSTALDRALQPVFALACMGASVILLHIFSLCVDFSSKPKCDKGKEVPELEGTWSFTKEIEPTFAVFGVAFGLALHCVVGKADVAQLSCFLAMLPGAVIIALVSFRGGDINITFVQRALLCICVLFLMSFQFYPSAIAQVMSAFALFGWAVFLSANYAFMLKKSRFGGGPAYRQIPVHLIASNAGVLAGWLLFAVTENLSSSVPSIRLVLGIVLVFLAVCVVMLFYPNRRHHRSDGTSHDRSNMRLAGQQSIPVPAVASDADAGGGADPLLLAKCQTLGAMYDLSPREIQVLGYLARGRNARYIEEKLLISQSTVKSHMHKIYDKFDIHSQQRLMDFIDSYPLDANVAGACD